MTRFPYTDQAYTRAITRSAVRQGQELFQIHRLEPTDRLHMATLMSVLDPPEGGVMADVGCGIGAAADHIRALRPDLTVVQLNVSDYQLGYAEGFRVQADFESLPFKDGSLDAAMLLYAIGHGTPELVLAECARALKPGGRLLIWDLLAREAVAASRMLLTYFYTVLYPTQWVQAIRRSGLKLDHWSVPKVLSVEVDDAEVVELCDPLLLVLEVPK
jgi:ubiquinone/menaquinone biosynthesis C-methylase UbiE